MKARYFPYDAFLDYNADWLDGWPEGPASRVATIVGLHVPAYAQ